MTNIEETLKMTVQTSESSNSRNEVGELLDMFISNEARRVLDIILIAALNTVLSSAGSVTNVINIVVFVKQGFRDSVNVSLCGLAVSDLGVELTMAWKCFSYNPLILDANIYFVDLIPMYYTGWPLRCFILTTNWITAFTTFERCVCVALPLKVKDIITHRRTVISVVGIFVTFSAAVYPVFAFVHFAPSFNAQRNITFIRLSYNSDGLVYENSYYFMNIFTELSSFIIVIVCVWILIHKLHAMSQWRHKSQFSKKSNCLSSRDKKVGKMVTAIAVLFIICNFPVAVNILLMHYFSSDYNANGHYQNIFQITWSFINMLEIFNSSAMILVYYSMSSKYRATFNELFYTQHSDRQAVRCTSVRP